MIVVTKTKAILSEEQSLQGTSGTQQLPMRDTAVTMKLVGGQHVMRVTMMRDRQQRRGLLHLNGMTTELRGVDEDWTNENVSMAGPMMVVPHQDNVMISMMIGREVGSIAAGRLPIPDEAVMMRALEDGTLTKETIVIVRTLTGTAGTHHLTLVGNLDRTLTDDFGMSQ